MRSRTRVVACLLFGSGFCALVYQVGWLRDFRLIFGASTAASAAVLAIFIGGLGLGGLLLGPRADRHPRPLLFYAHLETIVAVSAAASPLLLTLVRGLYISIGGSARLGGTLATIARLVLSVLVLAVPTIAMGGTLPAAARGVTGEADVGRHGVAALYALNTLGAVVGCLVATFWLLELLGTRSTLWLAAAINLLVAMFARQVDRSFVTDDALHLSTATPERPSSHAPDLLSTFASEHSTTHAPTPPSAQAPVPFVLFAAATVGFAFFLMELVWYRLLAPLLGGSVFTFGLVLAIALAGIGIGGLLYALMSSDEPATLSGFALACLVEAAAVAGTYAFGDRIALLALVVSPLNSAGFAARIAGWIIVAGLVVLPPALVAGYQFPLLIALFGRGRDLIGRQIGLTYAANTIGAIVGALAGGFGLMPWLSAPGAWRLVAGALLLLGIAAAVLALRQKSRPNLIIQTAFALVTVACMAAAGPTAIWRHSGIGAGRARMDSLSTPNRLRAWTNMTQRGVVWQADGTESGVALIVDPTGYTFIVNGKSDGGARSDSGTQVMLGLVGALTAPNPRRALVIGLGTGSSAGWLGAVPTMERVDVVELEPLILDVARACQTVNHDALNNPKVHVTIGDAREMLLTSTDRYDMIASEPSNPFRAGVASLFTLEYYQAAHRRLTDDGVFVQWVQGYEIDGRTLATLYATMSAVFPQVETWQTQTSDLVLVGSKTAHAHSARALALRTSEEPFRLALADSWRAVDLDGVLAHYLGNDALARAFASGPGVDVNTDDRNIVEFGLARSVGRTESNVVAEVRQLARKLNAARPKLADDAGINWAEADTAWIAFNAALGSIAGLRPQGPATEQARQVALLRYYENGEITGARNAWPEDAGSARDPSELMMLADIEADAGSDTALPLIDQLRAYQPGEADVLLAKLRTRQLRTAEAASALESALKRFQSDPWPAVKMKQLALELVTALTARDPSLTLRMFEALGQPFAVHAVDDLRLIVRASLSMQIDLESCKAAVGALEPNVPWTPDFLVLRHDCYQRTHDPRLSTAIRDLNAFAAGEAQPLTALVSASTR